MKILKILGVIVVLCLGLSGFAGCYNSQQHEQKVRDEIVTSIENRLSTELSADSLERAKVIVIEIPKISTRTVTPTIRQDSLIKLAAIIIPMIFGTLLLCILLYSKHKNLQAKCRIIEVAIMKNYVLPDSFYDSKLVRNNRLGSGIIWIGIGLAIMLFFMMERSYEGMAIGIVPLFVGISRITISFINNITTNNNRNYTGNDVDQI